MKTIYLTIFIAFAKRKSLKWVAAAFIFLAGMMPLKSFANDFPNELWTSVKPNNHCPGALVSYTLIANVENDANAAIGVLATVTITFPAGFTLSTITGGTFNGSAIGGLISTTATTVSFTVFAGGQVGKGKAFTVLLSGIRNTNTPGNYQLSMTIANVSGGTDTWPATVSSEFTISTLSTAPTDAFVDVNNFCTGTPGNISLTATGGSLGTGAVAKWYTGTCGGTLVGTGSPLSIAKPITTTTYFVRYEGCKNTTCDSIPVIVNPLPTISGALSVCPGATRHLTGSATPDATTPWTSSNTSVATVNTTGLVNGISPGTSVITYTNSNGCSKTATMTVAGLKLNVAGTDNQSFCATGTAITSIVYTVYGGTGATVTWSPGAPPGVSGSYSGGKVTFTGIPTSGGTYNYTVTMTGSACLATATGKIFVFDQGSYSAVREGGRCGVRLDGTPVTCADNSTASYQWYYKQNPGDPWTVIIDGTGTGEDYLPNNTDATKYRYRRVATCGACSGEYFKNQPVGPYLALVTSVTNNVSCLGGSDGGASTTVTGGIAPFTYTWTNTTLGTTQTTSTNSVTNLYPGSYTLVVKDNAGPPPCNVNDNFTITQPLSLPTAIISGTTTVCQNSTSPNITFTGSGGTPPYKFTYSISDGTTTTTFTTTTAAITTTVAAPTTIYGTFTYTLISVSDANNCSQVLSGTATITVNRANVAGTPRETSVTICTGGSDTLTETGGNLGVNAHWQWYTDPSFTIPIGGPLTTTDASLIVSPGSTTTYYLRAEGAASCGNVISGSITVNVNIPASISAHPSNTTTCIGTDAVFSVTAFGTAFTRQWQVSTDNGTTFTNISDGVSYTGTTTTSLTVKAPGFTMNGYQYRVVLTNNSACIAILPSDPATLTTRNTWTGIASNDWNNPNNWSNNVLPSLLSCNTIGIPIPAPGHPTPQLKNDVTVTNLGIAPGANLDLNGWTLTLNGAYTDTGYLKGPNSSGLVVGGNAGSLYFDPNSNYLKNLTINSSSSATLGNALNITAGSYANAGTLTANGTLNANGNLTIKSDINGDARIAQSSGPITGNVTVERFIVARRAWRYVSVPFSSSSQTIRDAWQEGVNNYGLEPGFRLDPNPGFGTHITGNNNSNLGFDFNNVLTGLNPSIKVWDGGSNGFDPNEPPTISTNILFRDAYVLFVRGSRAVDLSLTTGAPTDNTVLRIKGNLNETGNNISRTYSGISGGFILAGNPFASSINMVNILNGTRGSGFGLNKMWVWDPRLGGADGVGAYVTWTSGVWAPTTGGSYPAGTGIPPILQSGQAFLVQLSTGSASITFSQTDKTSSESNVTGRGTNSAKSANPYPVIYANLVNIAGDSLSVLDGVAAVFNNAQSKKADAGNALKMWNYYENMSLVRNGQHLAIEFRPMSTKDTLFYGLDVRKDQPYALQIFSQNIPDSIKGSALLVDKYLDMQKPVNLSDTTVYSFTPNADSNSYRNRFILVFSNQQSLVDRTNTLTGDSRSVGIFPNPVTGHSFVIQLSNFKAGKYEALIYNGKGTLIFTKELQHTGNNGNYKMTLPSTMSAGVYNLVLKKDDVIVKTVSLLIGE